METMKENYGYLYTIKEDNTICIHRIYGTSPEIIIPEIIENKSVSEIANYCFSNRKLPKALQTTNFDSTLYELCLDNVESIMLPDTIEKIGSFAFYNCKNLCSLSLPATLKQIGSDMFINCHKLHDLTMRTKVSKPTLLKQILTQIPWDIDVHFDDCTLFYSEYYEVYDEIGPAHIFGLNISGEGFRLRQCFQNNIVSLNEYDRTFEKLCIEESKETIAHFVMHRMTNNLEYYKPYILKNAQYLSKYIINQSLSNNEKIKRINQMLQVEALHKEDIDKLIDMNKNVELISMLMDLKKQYFNKSNTYDFEDF